jgi:hypothetical protein
LKKVLIWPNKNLFLKKSKKVSKNAEFHADFESVEKVVKKCTKKSFSFTFLLITFFWYIFSKVFQHLYRFFQKKFFFGHISTFFELWLQMRRKRLKKTENLFLWMYLRIQLCNHQRVCITKLLKSLYPNVHMFLVPNFLFVYCTLFLKVPYVLITMDVTTDEFIQINSMFRCH